MLLKSARILFLAVTAAAILLFLISCGDADTGSGGNPAIADADHNANAENIDGSGEGAEANQLTLPDLPDTNWQEKTITFLVRGPEFNEWQSQDIFAEAENGEPVNDAVYRRNAILEARYNFLIREVGTGAVQTMAERSIRSGDNAYQVIMADTSETNNLAMRGFLRDLRSVQYLDLSREYWDHNSIYGFTVGGKTMFMTGDLSVMANDATWIFMFNKELLRDLGLADPYALVKEGKWTADALHDMMRETARDLNGDGIMRGADDLFGLATHDSTFDGLFFSMGMRVSTMNSEGYPELSMNNERIIQVMEKTTMIMDRDITFNGDWMEIAACFEENRALFYGEVLQCVIRLRSFDTDFGVLPLPKLNEAQEDYAHMIHPTACMIGVPVSLDTDEADFTGFVLEAMAAESRNWLVPAYYTIALEGKFMRDEESKEMLDIILRTRRYDLGYAANWGNIMTGYQTSVRRGDADFASLWERSGDRAIAAMERAIEAYMEIE
jgi:ABC-type glycerol-3-phosphate transport system substrate-binding protein